MNSFEGLIESGVLFDSHCHLADVKFQENFAQVVTDAAEAGVEHIISVAIQGEDALQQLEGAGIQSVSATVGFHPEHTIPGSEMYEGHLAEDKLEEMRQAMMVILDNHEAIMIGETGMDLYWPKQNGITGAELEAVIDSQTKLLRIHCEIAQETGLPLTIHSRGTVAQTLEVLSNYDVQAVFHSFTDGAAELATILDKGYYIGINGIITYPSAKEFRAAIADYLADVSISSPSDLYAKRIVLETDAPYLAPQSHRGDTNQPAYLKDVFSFLQDL